MSRISTRLVRRLGTIALGVLIAMSLGISIGAQKPAPKRFAAVSIHPWVGSPATQWYIRHDPAGLQILRRTFNQIICYAYGLDSFQLTGGPPWLYENAQGTNFYVLTATTSAPATEEQMRAMLRETLAERLGLRLNRESKPTKVLALVVAKGGPKLRKLAPGAKVGYMTTKPGSVTIYFGSTKSFVTVSDNSHIERSLGRPLVDDTGLTGNYDIKIVLPTNSLKSGGFTIDMDHLSDAVKTLGLELKPLTQSIPIYTVVAVHRPTPN